LVIFTKPFPFSGLGRCFRRPLFSLDWIFWFVCIFLYDCFDDALLR